MTRVERYKNRGKVEKKKTGKATFIRFIKWIVTNALLSMYGTLILIYWFLRWINNLVTKGFMKLHRIARIAVIYTLVALAVFGGFSTYKVFAEDVCIIKEEILKVNFTEPRSEELQIENDKIKKELDTIKEENQKHRTIKSLNAIETDIYNKAIEVGLTHEQAILVISISKHETGKWTSNAFVNKQNFGGIMGTNGLRSYNSYEEGLSSFINLLKNRYFDQGLNTIEKIGAVYCPVGADNDPTGVNVYWIPNVTNFYNEYLSK